MKLICSKSNLLQGVNIVLKAVPSKTTMSILECILIDATAGSIKFTANDMELGIETIIDGDIISGGMVAIDAKIFSEIVRKLPDNEVVIETDENYKTTITCEKAVFTISGKSGEDFSYLPVIEKNKFIYLSQFTLKEIIRQTIFSIADNDNNKLMTGELFEVKNNELKVVSLDGHRISIRKVELKESFDDIKVVVPGKTLNEISKILSGGTEDEVRIFFTSNHIVFEFDNTVVVSRLIEGEYFKIDQMLSSDYETKFSINKREFLDCIDRATLLVKEGDKKPIIINITDGNMELKISSIIGSMNENIDIIKEGKDIMIGFNPKFLIDALKVIDDEEVNIYMVNPKAPCFIRDDENKYVYLILPVNFTVS
jgi:DNA polymerase-3 subunit beta